MLPLTHTAYTVCGIDEAGRGALAGPLLAAAVVLTRAQERYLKNTSLPFRDSKLLSKIQREHIFSTLEELHIPWMTRISSVKEINSNGIGWSNIHIIEALIRRIDASKYVVDGNLTLSPPVQKRNRVRCIIDADAHILPVVVAGIIAKVTRDRIMQRLDRIYPWYAWKSNKGYGTKTHIEAIRKMGTTKHHRSLFVSTALDIPT